MIRKGVLAPSWLYILRLSSGRLYIGITQDLHRRTREHFSGNGGRTTESDPPIELAYTEEFLTSKEAALRERQVKGWSRVKKESLLRDRPPIDSDRTE